MVPMPAQLGVQFVPGTMLGRYELLATIGVGGMASVILARQRGPAGFEKVVVIKVVHPHMAQDPAAVNMLLDEAKVAAQIDHPNVVHTYELGEAYGTFYIVMEYLAGESLAQILKVARRTHQQLSPFLAGKIVADAAEGLHFAHELCDFHGNHLGIVHRDVSPGNIVVQYNGGVKVVDFGIAKAEGRVTSTQEGELKGKYGYMPPEQIKNEPMDRRSDVFSLGVVLWESLAQRRLFNANNVAATLMQVLTADRVPPSHFFPAIPHALDIACLRALAPDPADRFQTVAELKQAVDDAIWQARVGTKEIEQLMASLFADRVQMRSQLLRRATVEMLSVGDLEQLHTAFGEQVSEHQPHRSGEIHALSMRTLADSPAAIASRPPAPVTQLEAYTTTSPTERSGKTLAIMLGALLLGVVAALFFTLGRTTGSTSAPPVEPANDRLVLDPDSLPEGPTKKPAVALPPVPVDAGVPVVADAAPTPVVVDEPAVKKPVRGDTKPVVKKKPPVVVADKPDSKPETKPDSKPTGDAAALYEQAMSAHMSGDTTAAEAGYKRAVQANRSYAPAYRGLGILYQAKGNKAKAIEALKTYLRLSPNAKDSASVRARLEQLGAS